MSGVFNSEKYDNGGHLVACDIDWPEIMALLYAILKHGHAYIMANNRNVEPMLNAARWHSGKEIPKLRKLVELVQAALDGESRRDIFARLWNILNDSKDEGFKFHNLLVWDKVTGTPNRWYMKNCEFTGLFYKGPAQAINDCGSMSLIRYPHQDESEHPTEKPVSLMEHYILNSTQPGQLVIDPFMGSGSTGVAAVRAGRAFIGIELDEGHFNTALGRIRYALANRQTSMF